MGMYANNRATGKGPYRHQKPKWKASLAVGYGNLIYKDASDHYDKDAAGFTWNASLAQTQTDFKAVFRGVSDCRRTTAMTADGDESEGTILASGEFCHPCAALGSAAYVAKDTYVAPAQGTGNTLDGLKLAVVTNVSYAIGKLTRDAAAGATELYWEPMPATFTGGPQTIS